MRATVPTLLMIFCNSKLVLTLDRERTRLGQLTNATVEPMLIRQSSAENKKLKTIELMGSWNRGCTYSPELAEIDSSNA
jgi:hypothetical protein